MSTPVPQEDSVQVLREALQQVADADPVELALDPQWAKRVAQAALSATEGAQAGPTDEQLRAGVKAFQSGHNGFDNLSDWREFYRVVSNLCRAEGAQAAQPLGSKATYHEDGPPEGGLSAGQWHEYLQQRRDFERSAAQPTLRERFAWFLKSEPRWAPEFEPHRAWVETFAWLAVSQVAVGAQPPEAPKPTEAE